MPPDLSRKVKQLIGEQMKTIKGILIVLPFCFVTSCYDYTRSISKDKEITTDQLLESVKPNRTYVVKLRNGFIHKIRVSAIDRDSLSGSFYMVYPRVAHPEKVQSTISLQQIVEVKKEELQIAATILAIVVPLGVGVILLSNIAFSPFNIN
jgi:hypothetical protein